MSHTLPILPFRVYLAQRLRAGETLTHLAHDIDWSVARVRSVLDPLSGTERISVYDVEDALSHEGKHVWDLAQASPSREDGICRMPPASPQWRQRVADALGRPLAGAPDHDVHCEMRALAVAAARREWDEQPSELRFCPTCSDTVDVRMDSCEVCGTLIARPIITFRPGWEGVSIVEAKDLLARPLTTLEIRDALRAHVRGGPGFRAAVATLRKRKYLARRLGEHDPTPYLVTSGFKREGVIDDTLDRARVKSEPALWRAERHRALTWLAKHPRSASNVTEMAYRGKLAPELVREAARLHWEENLGMVAVARKIAERTDQDPETVRKQLRRAFKKNGWPVTKRDLESIPRSIDEVRLPSNPLTIWLQNVLQECDTWDEAARIVGLSRTQFDTLISRGSLSRQEPARTLTGHDIEAILSSAARALSGSDFAVPSIDDLYEIRNEERSAVGGREAS